MSSFVGQDVELHRRVILPAERRGGRWLVSRSRLLACRIMPRQSPPPLGHVLGSAAPLDRSRIEGR
jgi:hypothetical protein